MLRSSSLFPFLLFTVALTITVPSTVKASLSIWGFEDPQKSSNQTPSDPDATLQAKDKALESEAIPNRNGEEAEQNKSDAFKEVSPEIDASIDIDVAPETQAVSDPAKKAVPTPTEIENTFTSDDFSVEAFSDLIEAVNSEENVDQDLEVTYDMPVVPDNVHVKKYITLFQNRLRPNFEIWLARSGKYAEMIQSALRENNLPEDLLYLALIESGFNPRAFSRSKATGVWQFMKGTGKRYGLRIDHWIDERRDPVKSTHAAVKYLTELYNMFGSWPLALAGYNAGESRVYRTIVRVRTRDFWTLRESRHLRPETRNYVPKFMAATIIAKDPERYGFSVEYETPLQYDEVEIQNATYLSAIAHYAGVTVEALRNYNPELRRNVTPPRAPGYKIKLPPGTKKAFMAAYSPDKQEQIFVGRSFKHRVRKGQTISSIAQQYGVGINMLLETNGLHRHTIISVGQQIMINETPERVGGKHRIRRGESISTIASKYKVSIRRLLEANNLHKRSVIRAGKTLIIPGHTTASSSKISSTKGTSKTRKSHQIRSGESISTIAQKYAVRMRDLLSVNQLTKKSIIRAGHTLIIP
ncbi:Membrane-bound lytic murein transglycosylase D [hydrothermal vent metagenome]|uniref:Membrane-bound lytic murein transglycosylase D n=1 Tax=hydrothermal vent metagenome TaxID=652676 RepID=A0A3B1D338_9ZZZZ